MIALGRREIGLCVHGLKMFDILAADAAAAAVDLFDVLWNYLVKKVSTHFLGSNLERFLLICLYRPRVYFCENDPCRSSSASV